MCEATYHPASLHTWQSFTGPTHSEPKYIVNNIFNIHLIFHHKVPVVLTYIQLKRAMCGGPLPPGLPLCPTIFSHPTHSEPYMCNTHTLWIIKLAYSE